MLSVEIYIDKLGKERQLMQVLYDWLISFPGIEPRLKHGIPFFYRKSWVCYLNPQKKGGVEFVFLKAKQLDDPESMLDFKNRKMVAGIPLNRVDEIPFDYLGFLLQQALLVDLD